MNTGRIEVVDALRGAALCAIVIIHCLEHYNLYYIPQGMPDWLNILDKGVWTTTWFLLAGKGFSTFSLLFGFSFFIQLGNAERRGVDFRARFAWRMLMLVIFSQLHSLFYNGDILLLYSIIGLLLVAMCRFSTKTIAIVATVLIIQPVEWLRLILAAFDIPFFEYGQHWMEFAAKAKPVMENGNFFEIVCSNITYGQLYGNLWQIENGRICQIGGLFLYGLVAGRLGLFLRSEQSISYWNKLVRVAILLFIPLYFVKNLYPSWIGNDKSMSVPLEIALPSIMNFLFMVVLVGIFTQIWYKKGDGTKFMRIFIPYGKMSLTNYIVQSIIGTTIFYGFGFGLYKYTGATACFIIAIFIFMFQLYYSRKWLASHKQGPLEYLWKKLTYLGADK